MTRVLDRQQQWEWNADCQPTAYIHAEGHLWRYTWDGNHQLVEFVDPSGAKTQHEYDALGRLKRTTNALGQIERTDWHDRFDLPVAEIDAAGNRWEYTYDVRGNLIVVTDPEGHETEQAYDERGLPHTIRDARGGYKHMRWNARAQLVEYTDCSGKSTRYAYDERSMLSSVTDALGNATDYHSDALGRVTEVVDPEGGVQRFEYDELGRLAAVIDPARQTTRYERNARGLPTRRINPMGRSVEFVYDRARRLVKLVKLVKAKLGQFKMNAPSKDDQILAIETAAFQAISDLFGNHKENFYYCTLITTGEGLPPVLAAWSWEALNREIAKDPQLNVMWIKWSWADSPYLDYGSQYFNEVKNLFLLRPRIVDLKSSQDRFDELKFRL